MMIFVNVLLPMLFWHCSFVISSVTVLVLSFLILFSLLLLLFCFCCPCCRLLLPLFCFYVIVIVTIFDLGVTSICGLLISHFYSIAVVSLLHLTLFSSVLYPYKTLVHIPISFTSQEWYFLCISSIRCNGHESFYQFFLYQKVHNFMAHWGQGCHTLNTNNQYLLPFVSVTKCI